MTEEAEIIVRVNEAGLQAESVYHRILAADEEDGIAEIRRLCKLAEYAVVFAEGLERPPASN